ncbi:MAG: glutamate 5-kinase [Candidatus Omnitrophica bacterium]|nr:glutamate 5-kinase [Candidatus Omnitrophota bacterium]
MRSYKRIVIKVGTKVITSRERTLDTGRIKELVEQIASIQDKGAKVILVTSGAIGAGMGLLGLRRRPAKLSELQATASIGQNHLMQVYAGNFKDCGYLAGQILLTQEDFNDRNRYLNIRYTLETLLAHDAVPVINENDTVSTEEIKCGDNDRLASLVADVAQADLLVLLTDVDGLLDAEGKVIAIVDGINAKVQKLARMTSCDLGTGGMATKLEAAARAASAGIQCVIANGRKKDVLLDIVKGEMVGTSFKSGKAHFIAKKRWIAFSSRPKGAVLVDGGAHEALSKKDRSLLASGIIAVEGDFRAGDVIRVADNDGKEFARGLSNYSSSELSKIKGLKTGQIKAALGYKKEDEVVHKDNLVVL